MNGQIPAITTFGLMSILEAFLLKRGKRRVNRNKGEFMIPLTRQMISLNVVILPIIVLMMFGNCSMEINIILMLVSLCIAYGAGTAYIVVTNEGIENVLAKRTVKFSEANGYYLGESVLRVYTDNDIFVEDVTGYESRFRKVMTDHCIPMHPLTKPAHLSSPILIAGLILGIIMLITCIVVLPQVSEYGLIVMTIGTVIMIGAVFIGSNVLTIHDDVLICSHWLGHSRRIPLGDICTITLKKNKTLREVITYSDEVITIPHYFDRNKCTLRLLKERGWLEEE